VGVDVVDVVLGDAGVGDREADGTLGTLAVNAWGDDMVGVRVAP
jgi:hypothetical protein